MTTKKTPTTWEMLSEAVTNADCEKHTEKKGNLRYLSWAWAWGILKKHFPDASFEKHWFTYGDGYSIPYAMDKQGYAFVKVTVTVADVAITEVMPVLNHSNRAVQKPNSFQVNTALQRCLTKAIGYHGLGHYIYAGEDLSDDVTEEEVAEDTSADDEIDLGDDDPVEEAPNEDDQFPQKTLAEWRETYLDPPKKIKELLPPVEQTADGIGIGDVEGTGCTEANHEDWKQISHTFEIFMPSVEDTYGGGKKKYKSAEDCAEAINGFWQKHYQKKRNKTKGYYTTLRLMEEQSPEVYTKMVEIFGRARKAAEANRPFANRRGVIKDG